MNKVFISYVKENTEIVDQFCQELRAHGIQVWLDRNDIAPGYRWERAIRQAIQEGAFFIACFSREYNERDKTYMNEELTIAIEELRQRPTDQTWFIPVKLNECEIPDRDIGGGETLRALQYVNLYEDWDGSIQRILQVIQVESSEPDINVSDTEQHEIEAHPHRANAYNNVSAYYNRGLGYRDTGDFNSAIADFNEVIALKSDYADAYYNRGLTCRDIGDFESAMGDFMVDDRITDTFE